MWHEKKGYYFLINCTDMCFKVTYQSKKEAILAGKELKKELTHIYIKNVLVKRSRFIPYICSKCGLYHLTSHK